MNKPPIHLVDPTSTPTPLLRKFDAPGRSLWDAVQFEYRIEDCGGLELLAQACAAMDRLERLRQAIDVDGETVKTRNGIRAHPALRDELAARAFICRTLERLGITSEPIRASVGRPPKGT